MMNTNLMFDRKKHVLTCLDNIESYKNDEIQQKVEEQIKYAQMKLNEEKKEDDKQPYDKEFIILPRQKTFIQQSEKKSRFERKKKNRMIWDDQKKGWILRRHKRKTDKLPPIIEATKEDAYEDVFRKLEMQRELEKSKQKLKKIKKTKITLKKKQKLLQQ